MVQTRKANVEEVMDWFRKNGAGEVVLRTQAPKISNGFLQTGTLANNDSLGTGPKERVRFGKKVAYPLKALAEYMVSRGFILETVV